MLSLLGSIFGSVFAGGATGLLGLLLQKYFDLQTKKLDIDAAQKRAETELALKDKDLQIMTAEWQQRAKVAEIEGDAAIGVEAQKAFAQSIAADHATYLTPEVAKGDPFAVRILAVLEFARGVVRPVLTLALLWMSWQLYEQTDAILRSLGTHPSVEILQSQMLLISSTILYLATTVVTWWFGVRNSQQPPAIKR